MHRTSAAHAFPRVVSSTPHKVTPVAAGRVSIKEMGSNFSIPDTHNVTLDAASAIPVDETLSAADLEHVNFLTCEADVLQFYLTNIRAAVQHTEPVMPKKKRGKPMNCRQQEAQNEAIHTHRRVLTQFSSILQSALDEIDGRLTRVRQDESLLYEYYRTLDAGVEGANGTPMHRGGPFHTRERAKRREQPTQRYVGERGNLEWRVSELASLLSELGERERELTVLESHTTGAGRTSGVSVTGAYMEEGKLGEDTYDETNEDASSPEVRLLRHMLRPLWQKVKETRMEMPLPPRAVESRLRKDLILPFSARVLALKMDDAGNTGDRFVEWYVNTVLDPLAMAQLVELMPREYLVTTTVRLAKACDACLHLRQAQALPDISHVLTQSIVEGRPDALASLVLSPSGSYLRALEQGDQAALIFYAALITGQTEVLRRLISAGFYNANALLVWLFLNPSLNDSFYGEFVNNMLSNVRRFLLNEHSTHELGESFTIRGEREEDTAHTRAMNATNGEVPSFLRGLVEELRRLLHDSAAWRRYEALSTQGGQTTSPTGTFTTGSAVDVPFSQVLSKRRLDQLLLSSSKCGVLPAVSTSMLRRVDPWAYAPMEGTSECLLLLGDTSTAHAHVVQLPPQYTKGWYDEDEEEGGGNDNGSGIKSSITPRKLKDRRPLASQQIKRSKKNEQQRNGRSFYYEAHISIPFLLDSIPPSSEPYEMPLPSAIASASAIQQSMIFIGWSDDERVSAANGRSLQPPLGNDTHSIGISFDVLYRGPGEDGLERIILRPMRHTKGRTTAFVPIFEGQREEEMELAFVENPTLLQMRLEHGTLHSARSQSDKNSASNILPSYLGVPDVSTSSNSLRTPLEKNVVVPTIDLLLGRSSLTKYPDASLSDEGMDDFPKTDPFTSVSLTLKSLPVYGAHVLVVGCYVDTSTRQASFTLNGRPLGVAFTSLPSVKALRPAVALRATHEITKMLQHSNPAESAVVRFVFSADHLMDKSMIPMQSSGVRHVKSTLNSIVQQDRKDSFSWDNKPCVGREAVYQTIPGFTPSTKPLLFDDVMMQCSIIHLITQAESVLQSDVEDMLQGAEALSLGQPTMYVTAWRVRRLFKVSSAAEPLLFFPPLLVRRRSDEPENDSTGVTIIPGDASLIPLCAALTMRQRIAAYHIAVHPLSDFASKDAFSVRQRRMALLAAATLGYEEILYVLLERMNAFEVIALFTLRGHEERPTNSASVQDTGGGSRNCMSATSTLATSRHTNSTISMIHRVEYTPLHCALLEGHEGCAHLLLYYLRNTLSEEHRRHAINVLTRSGETALVMGCRDGRTRIAKRLLAMGASPASFDRVTRANCLELACASRSVSIAMSLLETPDYHSQVAVNHAGNASPLSWCALNNIGSLIRPLLQNGANPNVSLDGPTPLLLAVTFGAEEAALELLKWCDAATSDTATRKTSSSNDEVHETNSSDQARQEKQEQQGGLNTRTSCTGLFLDSNGLSKGLAVLNVDALDPRSQCSALHLACELGQVDVVRSLIEKGASLNLQNKSTYTNPLQMAIINGHEALALDILEHAKDKLRRGFNVLDIAAIDKLGDTALHFAAREGMLPVIEYIMSQFCDEEITRLSKIRQFTKRPNTVSALAVNRKGRTPLLSAIHAHKEEAAQLIASLMPESLSNPGGPVIDGTSMAILVSDAEGLDNVTLSLLSHPRMVAADEFRENFFVRYNAIRLRLNQEEDASIDGSSGLVKPRVGFDDKNSRKQPIVPQRARQKARKRRATNMSAGLIFRTSVIMATTGDRSRSGSVWQAISTIRRNTQTLSGPRTARRRRRSTFVQMLLAKGSSGPSTRKSIHFLLRGFAMDELYAMLEVVCTETSRTVQSRDAMQYAEVLIGFLSDHGGLYIASSDAVSFVRKLYVTPLLTDAMTATQVEEAKKRLTDINPLCRELQKIIRTRGHQKECIDEMRHLIEQNGVIGPSLIEELTSPFGFTLLQLASTLELPAVCEYLITECQMNPLYVSPISENVRSPFARCPLEDDRGSTTLKWLLTPFRLAVNTRHLATLQVFLSNDLPDVLVQESLEFKESLLADRLQQTALQELLRHPLDGFSDSYVSATISIVRQLLQHGAVVHGNPDVDGYDAWMLALRASPGKGIMLKVFLEEGVEMDDDDDDDYISNNVTDESDDRNELSTTADYEILEDKKDHINKNVAHIGGSVVPLVVPSYCKNMRDQQDFVAFGMASPVPRRVPLRVRREMYYAQLLFLCADHNPRYLSVLLERYAHVLSPSAFHPRTSESLVVFLLGKAMHIYDAGADSTASPFEGTVQSFSAPETALAQHLIDDVVSRAVTLTTGNITPTSAAAVAGGGVGAAGGDGGDANTNSSYRDPMLIPAVRTLLDVVERLLHKFRFDNLYHPRYDDETALSLAARLSHSALVSLIVRQENSEQNNELKDDSTGEDSSSSDCLNADLTSNLQLLNCWVTLATRLYYPEEGLETVLTIIRHLPDIETRFSFLGMVFSNLHPALALRIAAHFASDAKKFLMRTEAANAFWCNVLYARFSAQLETFAVTSAQWSSILSVLLPIAPAVPLYLIKAFPSLSGTGVSPQASLTSLNPRSDAFSPISMKSTARADAFPSTKATCSSRKVGRKINNWIAIVKRTDMYLKQLATAAAHIVAPPTPGQSSIPAVQRHAFASMAGLFHEIVELTVRFDNASLLMDLMTASSEELQSRLKYEWRWLMENLHFEVIAVAAGSNQVLRLISDIPEAAAYMSCERYDRIDPNTGFPEELRFSDAPVIETRNSVTMMATMRSRSFEKTSTPVPSHTPNVQNNFRQVDSQKGVEDRGHTPSPSRRQRGTVSIALPLLGYCDLNAANNPALDSTKREDDGLGENALQYMDVLTAARERTTASAVTWGIGAATKPVALKESVMGRKSTDEPPPSLQNKVAPSLGKRQSTSSVIRQKSMSSINVSRPSIHVGKGNPASGAPPLTTLRSFSPMTSLSPRGSSPQTRRATEAHLDTTEGTLVALQTEPVQYFAYYLCDWALHSTLVLHAPRPSVQTIETVLYLLDKRAPLTASVLQLFLAASRPMNHWTTSNGELLTITYQTRAHGDTLLHLLVQHDQVQLARYYLAATLFYFTRYQYDPSCPMPPQFPVMQLPSITTKHDKTLPTTQRNSKKLVEGTKSQNDDSDEDEEDEELAYPSVFLRCMMRMNKHGLTPFDYARGPMVALLMEYGCAPPSYRPNPSRFCLSIRLPPAQNSPTWRTFQAVPRVLLVSKSVIGLRDNFSGTMVSTVSSSKQRRGQGDAFGLNTPDATLIRNQASSQRATGAAGLLELPMDDVSLLHIGLCSAEDELVLQHIMTRRERQMTMLSALQSIKQRSSHIMPPVVPSPQTPPGSVRRRSSTPRRPTSTHRKETSRSSHTGETSRTPISRALKEVPSALGLLGALRERGFVAFPLVLPLSELGEMRGAPSIEDEEIAILISMTPMMLAQCVGAVKKEETTVAPPNSRKKQNTKPIIPRFVVAPSERGRGAAEHLEAWIATRKQPKSGGKDPNTQTLVKALGTGSTAKTIRALDLATAPSYEPKNLAMPDAARARRAE